MIFLFLRLCVFKDFFTFVYLFECVQTRERVQVMHAEDNCVLGMESDHWLGSKCVYWQSRLFGFIVWCLLYQHARPSFF